jgi:mono/diheme cytochrome c family protein
LVVIATGFAAPLVALFASEPPKVTEAKVDFAREVQPIFAKRCFACHGPDEAEGGLRLNEKESAFGELDSGSRAIVAGNLKRSILLAKIAADDLGERMPPEGKPLSKTEIDTIRRWIEQGAEWKSHWAFESPRQQSPPSVGNAAWVRNPIDAFILRKLEEHGLSPNPPAEKIALIRRAYYNLTGLPPSPEEVGQFLANESPDAYERLIDRLLASPQYGERWARHWLDAVRYAETNSFERDGPKPNAWRYRDYVIRSFNDDKPYDQFIREQLAGDELPEVTNDTIIATGYYRLGLWDDEPADAKQARFDELDDIVSTTSQVFLGLTVNCARCHDHKIDPIPQDDYYRLLAYFHEVRPYGVRSDQTSWNQTDIGDPAIAQQHAQVAEQRESITRRMKAIEDAGIARMPAEFQRLAEGEDRQKVIRDKLQEHVPADDWQKYTALRDELRDLRRRKLPPREMALSVKCLPEPPETFVLARGNPHVTDKKVEPGVPKVFQSADPALPQRSAGVASSGRRLTLANWIASPDNMLTARVMANRIWQFHFGRGIVRSSNNFGQLGDPPTHPELLDWLAQEFVAGGWKMKSLHKLIMLSNAYQMSSRGRPDALEKDPQNQLFWRFDMRRLSAEEVRDSIHAVTGQLNPEMYGPSYYPEISAEVLAGQSQPGAGWGDSSEKEQARRSIYIHVKRSLITPILADFDFPEPDVSCAARFATVHPAQALGMMNGSFMQKQAGKFAERLMREAGDDRPAQIKRALRLAVLREPTEAEIRRGISLIESLEAKHKLGKSDALKYYCLVVLNLNEFAYLD